MKSGSPRRKLVFILVAFFAGSVAPVVGFMIISECENARHTTTDHARCCCGNFFTYGDKLLISSTERSEGVQIRYLLATIGSYPHYLLS